VLQQLLLSVKRRLSLFVFDLTILRRKRKTLQYVLGMVIFVCLGTSLLKNWSGLKEHQWHFRYSFLALSFLLLVGISFFLAFNWSLALRFFSQGLGWRQGTKIWLLSQIAKYLPGSIWNLVGRVYWCEREGIPKIETIGSIVLETVLTLVSGAIVVLGVLFLGVDIGPAGWKVISLAAVLGGFPFVVLTPSIWNKGLNFALRIFGRDEIHFDFDNRRSDILILLILYILAAILGGLSFYFFTLSVYPLPLATLLPLVGIYWISFLTGFISPFAPSGLGIRESVLAFLLSYYLPTSVAIVISLLARIWLTIGELISVAIAFRL